MLLTRAELIKLTGYRQYARQIEWLVKNNISYYVSASGEPSVTWAMVNNPKVEKTEEHNFNLEALDYA